MSRRRVWAIAVAAAGLPAVPGVRGLDPPDHSGVELTDALLAVLIDDADDIRMRNGRPDDGTALLTEVAELQLDNLDAFGVSFSPMPVGLTFPV